MFRLGQRKGVAVGDDKAALQVDGFYGTVVLRDWMRLRDGTQVIGFTGNVRILDAQAATGIKPRANEAAWLARVEGVTESVNLMGCGVRGVYVHGEEAQQRSHDYWRVP